MPRKRGREDSAPRGQGGAAAAADLVCAVCLKTAAETEQEALCADHGCSVCVAGAWCICLECHASLLSRDCPICRSPYEGLELFPFECADPPTLADRCCLCFAPRARLRWRLCLRLPSIRTVIRCMLGVILHTSNVIVWERERRRASFMLSPANPGASGSAGKHVAVAGIGWAGPIWLVCGSLQPAREISTALACRQFSASGLPCILAAGVDLSGHSFGEEQGGQTRYLFDTSLWSTLQDDDNDQDDEEDKVEMVPFGAL